MNVDLKLQKALEAHMGGRIQEAESLYRDVLQKRPRDPMALHNVGIIYYHRREYDAAVDSIRKALAVKRNYPEALSNLGNVLRDQGKHEEAVASYREAIRQRPRYVEAYSNLGAAYLAVAKFDEAIEALDTAIKINPNYMEAHFNRALALKGQGSLDDAIAAFRQVIAMKPDLVQAHLGLALTLAEQRRFEEAIAAFQALIALVPNAPEPYANLSLSLQELGRLEEAAAACRKAIELKPDFALAYYNLGTIVRRLGRLEEGVDAFKAATVHAPQFAEAYCNLGLALMDQGKTQEAVDAYRKAVQLRPNFPEALNNLGVPLRQQEKLEEALEVYRQAVAVKPDYAEAYTNMGNILREMGKQREAVDAYEKSIAIDARGVNARIQLAHLRRHLCDWREFDLDTQRLFELEKYVEPFVFLSTPATAAQQLACSRNWSAKLPRGQAFSHAAPRRPGPIRVGYLSADFRKHATAFLMAELFERHDRSKFEIYAYSYGYDDGSDMRQRLINAFDHFVEFRTTPLKESAQRIFDDDIDILIDLKGYTGGVRTEILVDRPAPIQVNYIGYPGTMGCDFIDYIIGDPFVTPMEHQPFYSEKIVQLPGSYQPNDTKRPISDKPFTRAQFGLPEDAFVFASFNGAYKISPSFFSAWMRLLQAVPGSVLWMLSTNDIVEGNLRREAAARGVAPERLIYTPGLDNPEHLARHRFADLFIDTAPINAHTTASDALWGGLPVVTCSGEPFASRVAGSLLRAVGLPELITTRLEDYEALVLQLARDPERLRGIREKLARNRLTAPLFDIESYTRGLEAAYARMFEIWQAGQPPQAFAV